jgi:phage protein U
MIKRCVSISRVGERDAHQELGQDVECHVEQGHVHLPELRGTDCRGERFLQSVWRAADRGAGGRRTRGRAAAGACVPTSAEFDSNRWRI